MTVPSSLVVIVPALDDRKRVQGVRSREQDEAYRMRTRGKQSNGLQDQQNSSHM
jgi:hypothetical protein